MVRYIITTFTPNKLIQPQVLQKNHLLISPVLFAAFTLGEVLLRAFNSGLCFYTKL